MTVEVSSIINTFNSFLTKSVLCLIPPGCDTYTKQTNLPDINLPDLNLATDEPEITTYNSKGNQIVNMVGLIIINCSCTACFGMYCWLSG